MGLFAEATALWQRIWRRPDAEAVSSPASAPDEAAPRAVSQAFEAHIVNAANIDLSAKTNTTATVQTFSSAWDETEGMGIESYLRKSDDNTTEQQRKDLCEELYRVSPWVSSSINVIAKRITSGGFAIEELDQGKGDKTNYQALYQFCLRINPHWDFLQLLRSIITDLLIYGEAYVEIVFKDGLPYQLYKVDCKTMSYELEPHGNIVKYKQQLSHSNKILSLEPKYIIRWWLPHPGKDMMAQSPIELMLDALNLDRHMVNWQTGFFQRGAKPPFWIKGLKGEKEALRFMQWFTETFTGDRNAHVPLMTYGENTEIKEFSKGAVDVDFPSGRERNREEQLAVLGVPPMSVGVIKTAGLGGTGEDQEKSLQYNTCDPIKGLVMEKLNWRVVEEGFGIHDHRITTRYADYRNDKDISAVQDQRIRNATLTIDEARAETGKKPYPGGDGSTAVFATSKEVMPISRLSDLHDEQQAQAQIAIQQSQAQVMLLKAQAAQLKISNTKALQTPATPPPSTPDQGDQGTDQGKSSPNGKGPQSPKGNTPSKGAQASQDGSQHAKDDKDDTHNVPPGNGQKKAAGAQKEHTDQSALLATILGLLTQLVAQERGQHEEDTPRLPTSAISSEITAAPTGDPGVLPILDTEAVHADLAVDAGGGNAAPGTGARCASGGNSPAGIVGGNNDHHSSRGTDAPPSPLTLEGSTSESERERPAVIVQHTGMMVAFFLAPEVAAELAIPGGEPESDLHLTLAFLGEESEFDGNLDKLKSVIASFAAEAKPLQGKVSGVGKFAPSDGTDSMSPLYASVDVPGLAELRTELVKRLEATGFPVNTLHDFTPHVTLKYLPTGGEDSA